MFLCESTGFRLPLRSVDNACSWGELERAMDSALARHMLYLATNGFTGFNTLYIGVDGWECTL